MNNKKVMSELIGCIISSVRTNDNDVVLNAINCAMKEIGTIDLTDEVKKANGSLDGLIYYSGIANDYPIIRIEYDEVDGLVWVRYINPSTDSVETWNDDNVYCEEELRYCPWYIQLSILEKIKSYLEETSK